LKLIKGTFLTCLPASSHGAIIDRTVLAISIHRSLWPCPCGLRSHRFCGTKSNYLYIWLPGLLTLPLAQGNNISCPHRRPATFSGCACVRLVQLACGCLNGHCLGPRTNRFTFIKLPNVICYKFIMVNVLLLISAHKFKQSCEDGKKLQLIYRMLISSELIS